MAGNRNDIYAPTLEVAKENALAHDLQREICCGAWFEALEPQKFDLIVSNPPYIDPEDEHMQALATEHAVLGCRPSGTG